MRAVEGYHATASLQQLLQHLCAMPMPSSGVHTSTDQSGTLTCLCNRLKQAMVRDQEDEEEKVQWRVDAEVRLRTGAMQAQAAQQAAEQGSEQTLLQVLFQLRSVCSCLASALAGCATLRACSRCAQASASFQVMQLRPSHVK